MIEIKGIEKSFGGTRALKTVDTVIEDGCIYGLTGSNGAGKTTFLRLLCGILEPDCGSIFEGGKQIDRTSGHVVMVTDEQFVLPGASMDRMAKFYNAFYENFDMAHYRRLAEIFGLDTAKPIREFSRGMKHQAQTALALACRAKYFLFDEIFEGLDPVMCRTLRAILSAEVEQRKVTLIISSHSLRELEELCDHIIMLHRGELLLACDAYDIRSRMFKVQTAFGDDYGRERFEGLDIADFKKQGSVASLIIRGNRSEIMSSLKARKPLLLDIVPMTLEEILVCELSSRGYTPAEFELEEAGEEEEVNENSGLS